MCVLLVVLEYLETGRVGCKSCVRQDTDLTVKLCVHFLRYLKNKFASRSRIGIYKSIFCKLLSALVMVYRKNILPPYTASKVAEQFSVNNVNAHYGLFLKVLLSTVSQKLHTGALSHPHITFARLPIF